MLLAKFACDPGGRQIRVAFRVKLAEIQSLKCRYYGVTFSVAVVQLMVSLKMIVIPPPGLCRWSCRAILCRCRNGHGDVQC